MFILLVCSIVVSRLDAQYFIDNTLVGSRQEYASYKWNCYEYIEVYDLRLYNVLNTSVFSVLEVYMKQQPLLATCESFNTSRLNKTTRSNLKTTCNSLIVTFQQAIPEAQSALMSFYSSVGSQSELMDLAHELYTAVKEVLNNLVPYYSAHPKCVSRHLRTLANTYRFASSEISGLHQKLQRSMTNIFNKPFAASRAASTILKNLRNNLSKCDKSSQTDPDECVSKLVRFSSA